MEEKKVSAQNPNRWQWIWAGAGIAALLMVCVLLVFFKVNRFRLELRLRGPEKVVLEYGSEYEEEGALPFFYGTLFWKNGIFPDVPVEVIGQVDSQKLGRYDLIYRAGYRWWHAEASRSVRVVDTKPPVITLVPDPEGTVLHDQEYQEAGFSAMDEHDGDLTDRVVRTQVGGTITYAVTDASGNPARAKRFLPPPDYTPPQIHLEGWEEIYAFVGEYKEDPGFSAEDCLGTDLTDRVEVEDPVVWYEPGEYTITYRVTDDYEHTTEVSRQVKIRQRDRVVPIRPAGNVIYLTFDDGPGPYTEKLLDLLRAYDVKATFFVTDSGEEGYEEILQRIVREGHAIGIHSMTHDYHSIYASPEAYFADIQGMQQIIADCTGVTTWLMRFPGGSSNTVSSFRKGIMTTLTKAVEDAGFRYFDWNVDSNDAGGTTKSSGVVENVLRGISNQRISVVLQHDIHDYSVDAVEEIIQWGMERGYLFLPLQENSPTTHHGVNN